MKIKYILSVAIMVALLASGCRKSDFLNVKPNDALRVPSSIADFQGILDNDEIMNGDINVGLVPALGEAGADDYYVNDANYSAFLPLSRNCYIWAKQIYTGEEILDWDFPYRSIFYANVVLAGLPAIAENPGNQASIENLKGSALFFRAHMFYQLAQIFAAPYSQNSADSLPGVPLRLEADINEKIERLSLRQTYARILQDLKEAAVLLPNIQAFKTRPSKPAAYALLARVYQTMGDYQNAFLYADSTLQLHSDLIDFNNLDSTATYAIKRFNPEVLFHCLMLYQGVELINNAYSEIDSNLIASYDPHDLRKKFFFGDIGFGTNRTFIGSYDGSNVYFAGLATDEVYLIRAECNARLGNTGAAMNDLNELMKNRWDRSYFTDFTAVDANDALRQILAERRKELLMRGLRWTDLRRLNQDVQRQTILYRYVSGQQFTLAPNDDRYTYPVPDNVIGFNKGMVQNPR
jgi:hypothetical protein